MMIIYDNLMNFRFSTYGGIAGGREGSHRELGGSERERWSSSSDSAIVSSTKWPGESGVRRMKCEKAKYFCTAQASKFQQN